MVRESSDPDLEALRAGDEARFEVLIGAYHEPMMRNEVCVLLAISPVNKRVRLHRGRASVRKTVEEHLK